MELHMPALGKHTVMLFQKNTIPSFGTPMALGTGWNARHAFARYDLATILHWVFSHPVDFFWSGPRYNL